MSMGSEHHHDNGIKRNGSKKKAVAAPKASDIPPGKKIRVFKNGDIYHQGIKIVVNSRQIHDIDALLDFLNKRIELTHGVKKLYNRSGKNVKSLDVLVNDEDYVAATNVFVPLAYGHQQAGVARREPSSTCGSHRAMPFAKLPVLEVDGKQLPESAAIMRFLSKKFGLAGKNYFDAAWIDAIVDQFKDYYTDFMKYYYVALGIRDGGDKEALKKGFGEPARDRFFPLLVAQLKKSGTGFLVGDSLSFADLLIAEHTATLQEVLPGLLAGYPEILAHSKKIQAILRIKAWIEKRPKSSF